jgi:hypothetical protein
VKNRELRQQNKHIINQNEQLNKKLDNLLTQVEQLTHKQK